MNSYPEITSKYMADREAASRGRGVRPYKAYEMGVGRLVFSKGRFFLHVPGYKWHWL
jgi:hypothetical protein